jgi:predicted site-specific integrase-resolvase
MLTDKEAALELGVSVHTMRDWRKREIGPIWHKLEGRVRYDVADIQSYKERCRHVPSVREFMEGKSGSHATR